jgi:hypothetical protein
MAARLCKDNRSLPHAMPAAGVAIFKGNCTMHQINKKQLPCGFSWLLQRLEPISGIADVPTHHKRAEFAYFCACLRRLQAE